MGRPSNETKNARARETIIQTIAKLYDSDPALGGKWREHMVLYYLGRLGELVLRNAGFENPAVYAITYMAGYLREILYGNEGGKET